MGREFSIQDEYEVDASPEEIWAAIATGPGIDTWFVGHSEVEPGPGGSVTTNLGGGYIPATRVTTWEEGRRLVHATEPSPGGRMLAYEFLIEGRAGASTVIRAVTSGFLPGDDWEAEFEAMGYGTHLFIRTLAEALTHFRGRTATPVAAFSPGVVTDWDGAWARLQTALGLPVPAVEGAAGRFVPAGAEAPVDAAVYFTNPHTLGLRTGDALYRFIRGLNGPMVASHKLFGPGMGGPVSPDQSIRKAADRAWADWFARVLA
jgi:uncharacterized protein YndB with AHSA1/START domain